MTHDERVLRLLADGQPHSHHELYSLHVVAHSRVASLRAKGHRIECWREGDLYLYRLALEEEGAGLSAAVAPSSSSAPSSPASPVGVLSPGSEPSPIPGQLSLDEVAA